MKAYRTLCNRFGSCASIGTAFLGVPALTLGFNQAVSAAASTQSLGLSESPLLIASGGFAFTCAILFENVSKYALNYKDFGPTRGSDVMQKIQMFAYGVSFVGMSALLVHAEKVSRDNIAAQQQMQQQTQSIVNIKTAP